MRNVLGSGTEIYNSLSMIRYIVMLYKYNAAVADISVCGQQDWELSLDKVVCLTAN